MIFPSIGARYKRYWLLRRSPHYSEIHSSTANTPWTYDKVFVDVRLQSGDVVYLTAAADELYGWGHVIKRESYRPGLWNDLKDLIEANELGSKVE